MFYKASIVEVSSSGYDMSDLGATFLIFSDRHGIDRMLGHCWELLYICVVLLIPCTLFHYE
jgi:hypothetical protein